MLFIQNCLLTWSALQLYLQLLCIVHMFLLNFIVNVVNCIVCKLSSMDVMIVIAVRGGQVVNSLCIPSRYLTKLNTATVP